MTPTLSAASATALVLGGGVIGLMSALALRREGFQVRLLERGEIGRQASWAGGGILSPLYPWRAPEPVWQLAADSMARYPELCRELAETTGIDPEWTPSGMAVFDAEQFVEARAWCRAAGLAAEPREFGASQTGLWLPWVAQLRNPRLCRALHRRVLQLGVQCEAQLGELRLEVEGRQARVVDPQGGRQTADLLLVSAGAWSAALLAGTGWEPLVFPVKGQMILLRPAVGTPGHIVLHEGRYLIPRRDGRILVGSTVEPGAGFDQRTDPAAADELLGFARRWLPAAARLEIEAHWAGIRPGSADECPFIGRHPTVDNLYLNAGHYRNGLTLAPASAETLLKRHLLPEPGRT